MQKYLLKRFVSLLGTLLGVSILVFLMVHMIPGDPVRYIMGEYATDEAINAMKVQLGLDQPLIVQYFDFLARFIQGDLGTSLMTGITVWEEIVNRFPITFQLACYSVILGSVLGVLMGVIAAVKQNTLLDRFIIMFSLIGISAPGFWIALFLIWVFAYKLGWFPISGYEGFFSLVLPAVTLSLLSIGNIARMTRSSMLDVIKQDYMRTAEAKGAPSLSRVFSHGLQNAIIPVITLIGIQFGSLLAGAVITETVFALPGIGNFAIEAISKRDIPTVQGVVLFMAMIYTVVNLTIDIVYSFVDPRIRYE
ncbi:ABC transporter permease [Brevibacillus daliensis]|uniref:ABC transporter permease n=1 Tax=Brevibacillus daliensis TaxID=2892995 RepID=UPI001E2B4B85|nr:ABC transporter permease [Brevibacillus daliensis]